MENEEVEKLPPWPGERCNTQIGCFFDQLGWLCIVIKIIFKRFMRWIIPFIGHNSESVLRKINDIKTKWKYAPTRDWLAIYKDVVSTMTKGEFTEFKLRGLIEYRRNRTMASRGMIKLVDLLNQSKVHVYGNVLNLCSGAGGWDQELARRPEVVKIRSVTYGATATTPGHEVFSTLPFAGREKIDLRYGDAREEAEGDYQWVLFDGGESYPDPVREADKFYALLTTVTRKHIKPTTNFILKILTPTDERVSKYLKEIQEITGTGALYRSSQSRTTSTELYFISTARTSVDTSTRNLLQSVLSRAEAFEGMRVGIDKREDMLNRNDTKIPGIEKLKKPNYERSIAMLGSKVAESGRAYLHWDSRGVYPFGISGSRSQPPMKITGHLTNELKEILPGMNQWVLTDTTPRGFAKVFNQKVDNTPIEDHKYIEYMKIVYSELAERMPSISVLTDDEILKQANQQGAPGATDTVQNIKEFFATDWRKIVMECEEALYQGKPIHAIWSTMGKREKKKTPGAPKGSRMIAYLPIAMRIVELKYLGQVINFTKPENNPMGVGGIGLHDLGERMNELWMEAAMSDDIAGWDTKVSAKMLEMEHDFIQRKFQGDARSKEIIKNLFKIYKHPLILIPMESDYVRSELVEGFGQRLSGSIITYGMNTISRQAVLLTTVGISESMTPSEIVDNVFGKKIRGMISGDDCVLLASKEVVRRASRAFDILNEMGMVRKDLPLLSPTPIQYRIEDVSFCSHSYERISYYDEVRDKTVYRYMPTRDTAEILGKASTWLGMRGGDEGELAWITTQGSNLLACYHHMRLPRLMGIIYKSIAPSNLLLVSEGPMWKKTPWLRHGDMLDIINRTLFGESTIYPVPDFEVRRFSHLGYLPQYRENIYNNLSKEQSRLIRRWKVKAMNKAYSIGRTWGGDLEYLEQSNLFQKLRFTVS
uniref:NS5-like protein n=1 Tax=Changjiang Jingmen-like virus TaxID=1922763 RepID=A0A1L3KF93_9VIRU|nr:NS5-like protein [Changjiang Jingmen-like virus]